ncbi:MAG TPA: methyltransferase domain-containing protein [Bacteroidia bacterium]|nr:methyltransferase domain-containing protein [Bacteroidia bacterium]HNS11121.1 methyltransferase domain-containing protein [Bacteroidia bacterium]
MLNLSDKEIAAQLQRPHGQNAFEIGEFMARANEMLYLELSGMLQVKDNSCILEIGPGNGKFIAEIVSTGKGLKYTAIDYSKEMVALATKNNLSLIENKVVDITEGDCRKMHFEAESFDIVIAVNTIYFWDPIEAYLQELKRVLRKNGKLYLVYRSKSSMMKLPFAQYGFSLYDSADIDQLLLGSGFKDPSSKALREEVKSPDGEILQLESFFTVASSI